MALVEVRVCDKCGSAEQPVLTYEVSTGDRKARVDLCGADAASLEAFLPARKRGPQRGSQGTAKKAASPRRRGRATTIEEIEKLKKR